MAASTHGAMKAEDDAACFGPPELSHDQQGSFASACSLSTQVQEATCKEETVVCNAQRASETSPRLVQETQLMDHELVPCCGAAPNPPISTQLESNSTLGVTDTCLPPMVASVTNDLLKVSINHALGSTEECTHLANGEGGQTQGHGTSMLFPVNADDAIEGNASGKEAHAEPKLLSSNGHAEIIQADGPSLQTNDSMVGHSNGMPVSLNKEAGELGGNNDVCCGDDDDEGNDDNDNDEEEKVNDDDDDVSVDDDEEVTDSISDFKQGSDSSSSTSSLSFLESSSSDDDDEVDSLNRLLNGANNPEDVVMEEESECEEGELKESPLQRKKKGGLKKKTIKVNSEEEEDLREPARPKKKEKDLPYVPKVSVTLKEYHKTVPVGFVSSIVGVNLIVEGLHGQQALTEGSILWLTDKRLPLGVIDELFGPVKKPFYVVRYNDAAEIPEEAKEGAQVSYVQDFADFVLKNPDLFSKGYDDSANEDDSDSEVYFSDDEKEAEYKRSKSRMKRGNSESSTLEVDKGRHQERRSEGKWMNRDNKNWRSRGENARAVRSNQEFGGRPPRHQNARFQRHQSERELPYGDMEELMQTSHEQNRNWHGSKLPVRQAKSQQSVGVGQPKPLTPAKSTSDGSIPSPSQMQLSNLNPSQSTSSPNVLEPIITTNQSCTSQPAQMNQVVHNTLLHAQPQSFPQPALQQVQLQQSNHPRNLVQLSPQQIQTNEANQSTLPQGVQWQATQLQMRPLQSPSIQHSQMPVYGHALVAGNVPQVAIGGCGISLPNNPPLQPGSDVVQGLPSAFHSPIYQQSAPTFNQFSSSMPPFPGQGSQVPPNMGMPIGTQMHSVPGNCFPVGVQPTALAAPVLGIPAGQANIPFNYPMQMVGNQNFSGFTPAFANQNLSAPYRVPEQARTMQPMATASWQHPPQNSSALPPQQPFHQMRGPPRGRRF